jgi:hypothetical protein
MTGWGKNQCDLAIIPYLILIVLSLFLSSEKVFWEAREIVLTRITHIGFSYEIPIIGGTVTAHLDFIICSTVRELPNIVSEVVKLVEKPVV